MVTIAFEALSDGPVLSAIARAIAYIEVIGISIFTHKHLAGRRYTPRVNDLIIAILEDAVGTGVVQKLAIAGAMKDLEPAWVASVCSSSKVSAA